MISPISSQRHVKNSTNKDITENVNGRESTQIHGSMAMQLVCP